MRAPSQRRRSGGCRIRAGRSCFVAEPFPKDTLVGTMEVHPQALARFRVPPSGSVLGVVYLNNKRRFEVDRSQ